MRSRGVPFRSTAFQARRLVMAFMGPMAFFMIFMTFVGSIAFVAFMAALQRVNDGWLNGGPI